MTGRLPRLHGHRVQLCPARTTYTKMIEYRIPYRAVAGARCPWRAWRRVSDPKFRISSIICIRIETRYHFTFYTVP